MSETHTELPWRVELELVSLCNMPVIIHSDTRSVEQCRVVACFKIIPHRCVNIESHTERRALYRAEDDARFHVEAFSCYLSRVVDSHVTYGSLVLVHQCLGVHAFAFVVNIVNAEGYSPVETVIDIAADVKVIFTYVAAVATVEHVSVGIVIIRLIVLIVEKQRVVI